MAREPQRGEKTPGQVAYEKFCEQEYQQKRRVWNRWELVPPDERAKWEHDAMRWGGPAEGEHDGT
jgi:hypothetical protein